MVLYSVFDRVSGTHSPLASGLNREVVKRNIRLGIQAEVNLQRTLDDYSLIFYGSFDEATGVITLDEFPTPIAFSNIFTEKEEI